MNVVAVKLVARDSAGVYAPKEVDLAHFTCGEWSPSAATADDANAGSRRTHVTGHAMPPLTNGAAHDVVFTPVHTRYVELRVNDSYESGPVHYNFQLAEFRVAVRLTADDKQFLAAQARAAESPN